MATVCTRAEAAIERLQVSAYTIPTDAPEADGTYSWDRTTLVLVEVAAGGERGLGYTYADTATARLVEETLAGVVHGRDALAVPAAWVAMVQAIRNLGRPGIASMAIAAVDSALWDLKARLLGVPLVTLLGAARDGAAVYGSGSFTSYSVERLQEQLGGWAAQGIPRVKMKVGTHPTPLWRGPSLWRGPPLWRGLETTPQPGVQDDLDRVRAAREAIGPGVELFVDANGAYSRKQALAQAEAFAGLGVSWFEEPVSSDDLAGLRLLRDRGPAGMDVAAGEYGYDLGYFRRMLEAEAVDVLQADATRCAGITGFLHVVALCQAHHVPLSAHCAPSLHVHPCCAAPPLRHLEYFHDHARIEHLLFDGALTPVGGMLRPDLSRPGMGLEFKHPDAERFKAWG